MRIGASGKIKIPNFARPNVVFVGREAASTTRTHRALHTGLNELVHNGRTDRPDARRS